MRFIDWFLRPGLPGRALKPDDLARGRFLVGLLGLGATACAFFAIQAVAMGSPLSVKLSAMGTVSAYLVALAALRRTGKVRLVSIGWGASVAVGLLGSAYFGAGYRALISDWSITITLLLTYLAGLRAGIWTAVAITIGAVALFILERAGIHSPDPFAVRFMYEPVTAFLANGLSLIALLVLSGLFLRAQHRARSELEQSLAELQDTQARLLEASRRAGMADVASSVLHNVGNALNSVNVSAGLIAESLGASRVARLSKVVGMIAASGQQSKQVEYLQKLADALEKENATARRELELLRGNIEHIKIIISTQQTHARASAGLIERVSLAELVDEALRLASVSREHHPIEVARIYEDLPALMLDKHKLLEILINLMTNARQALCAPGVAERRIEAHLRRRGPEGVTVEILDTGCGIESAHIGKIFSHGFTTKKDGHGFGLHASALAARQLGGTLSCRSDGPGRGAAFRLDLPG
jgi:signal transduction histidine kinase